MPYFWSRVVRSLRIDISSFSVSNFFNVYLQVIFSIYYCYLARRVSGSAPFATGAPKDIQIAYSRLLKAGLRGNRLPSEGGDLETLALDDRPESLAETIAQLDRHDPRAIEFRHSLRNWFCQVPFSSIKLHHMEKWVYWTMYNELLPPLDQISQDRRCALDKALALLQRRIGCEIPEGQDGDGDVQPLLLTLDKPNILWRPLSFYCGVSLVNWCVINLYLKLFDMRRGNSNGIE